MSDHSLLNLFTADLDVATQLLALIEAEYQALQERDLPQLDALLENKKPLLNILQQHAIERAHALTQAGHSADREGLHSFASHTSNGAALLEASEALAAQLQECQNGNLRNGRLIRANQMLVNGALEALRGNETPSLYDSRGSSSNINRNRPLSQA